MSINYHFHSEHSKNLLYVFKMYINSMIRPLEDALLIIFCRKRLKLLTL